MTPYVVGLDLSLDKTGVAQWPAAGPHRLSTLHCGLSDLPRLQWIRARVSAAVRGADLVVVEGLLPAGAGQGSAYANERAGLYWLILDRLHQLRVPFAVCNPSSLKMYALGVGAGKGATKAAVVSAVTRRYDASPSSDDEADALVLAAMGLDHLGCSPSVVPQAHRRALAAVRWPV